jgi:hypothetical protein
MPVTFDAFLKDSQSQNRQLPTPNPIRQLVIEQLIRSKIVSASAAEKSPTAAETAQFLSDQILTMHHQILKDGSANMNERRLSYQAVCTHFLTLLAVAGGIEFTQE